MCLINTFKDEKMYEHIISFGESMRFPLAATSSTWQSALISSLRQPCGSY